MRSYYLTKEWVNTLRGKRLAAVLLDDLQGVDAVAFRSEREAVVWAVNPSKTGFSNVVLDIKGREAVRAISVLQWTTATRPSGAEAAILVTAGAPAMASLPALSISRFAFPIEERK